MNKKYWIIISWTVLIVVALCLLAFKKQADYIAQNITSTCRITDENNVKCDCDIFTNADEQLHLTATYNKNSCDDNMCISLCSHYVSTVKQIHTNISYWKKSSKSACDVIDSKTINCNCTLDYYIEESDMPSEHIETNFVLPGDNCDDCASLCKNILE